MGRTLSFWTNDVEMGVDVRSSEGRLKLEEVALSLGLILPSKSWEIMLCVLS